MLFVVRYGLIMIVAFVRDGVESKFMLQFIRRIVIRKRSSIDRILRDVRSTCMFIPSKLIGYEMILMDIELVRISFIRCNVLAFLMMETNISASNPSLSISR